MLPGALGTQLLPRLISFENCLKMCVDNAVISGEAALSMGLVDQVIHPAVGASAGVDTLLARITAVLENHLIATKGAMYPSPFRRTSCLPVRTSVDAALGLCARYKQAMRATAWVDNREVSFYKGGNTARRGAMDALLACAQHYVPSHGGQFSFKSSNGFMAGVLVETEINK